MCFNLTQLILSRIVYWNNIRNLYFREVNFNYKGKKIISTILCILTISASTVFPVSAAKSANLSNTQIVNKVNLFNSSRLEQLDYYIYRTDIESIIVRDLVDLYKRLDNLVVSDIDIANELLAPANIYDSTSIGSQLEDLFSCFHAYLQLIIIVFIIMLMTTEIQYLMIHIRYSLKKNIHNYLKYASN